MITKRKKNKHDVQIKELGINNHEKRLRNQKH